MACSVRNAVISKYDRSDSGNTRYVPTNNAMTAKTRRFSKNQSCRSKGAIAVVTQTRAYVPKSVWSNRWSRKLVRMWDVEVEIMVLGSRKPKTGQRKPPLIAGSGSD